MAGEYMYNEEPKTVTRRFEKILKIFIIAAVLFLAAELIWLLGVSPFKPLARVDIIGLEAIGNGEITREDILTMAGITPDTSYISANTALIEVSLLHYGFLESVSVYRQFPDRLEIVLEGRRAVASAFVNINGITVPVLIDRDGVIFSIGGEKNNFSFGLPVISGLIIEDPYPGMRLPVILTPLFNDLEKIGISSPELLGAVSEIRISRRSWDAYDIEIFPVHNRIRVRLTELNEDILRYTLLMVDVLSRTNSGIESLDFRSGIASYIPREVPSER